MRHINKSNPPEKYVRYCRCNTSNYRDLTENHKEIKSELRNILLSDQGYICCYCGRRIDPQKSVIEHLACQQYYPQKQLDFNNLLCSCNGGRDRRTGNPSYPLSCDAAKDNLTIPFTPLESNCEERFGYDENGVIYGIDEEAKSTIEVLNLDNEKLNHQRKAAIDTYKYIKDYDWESEIEWLSERDSENRYPEFCMALIKYIRFYKLVAC